MSSWKRKRLEAMGEEDLHDAHLVGTDGEEVPCCKAALAMISPVFRSMFFKGFREQKSDHCNLDYHSVIIRTIVKYCYCGEVDIDLIFKQYASLEEEVSLLLDLRQAGQYFEIEDLSSAAEAKIASLVFQTNTDRMPYLYAPAFLTEFFMRREARHPLGRAILTFAANNIMRCFGPRPPEEESTDRHHIHPAVLAPILKGEEDAYIVVRCLQTWFCNENKSGGNNYRNKHKRVLIELAEHIDLEQLDTAELSNVKPCSLFSSERILEAFVHNCKSQVVKTERTKPALFVSGRSDVLERLEGFCCQVRWKGQKQSIWHLEVKYNGSSCKLVIHRRPDDNKWLVSIADCDGWLFAPKVNTGRSPNDRVVHEKTIIMHLYESSDQSQASKDPTVPPFSGWKCFGGTDTVPFFASMFSAGIK